MANITITNVDIGGLVLEQVEAADAVLKNADTDDPVTFEKGTILARHSSDLKLYPFDPAGSNGLNAAKAVLTYDVEIAANGESGVRVLIAGKVNQNRLKIHGGTTITAAHLDGLRDYGIIPVDVKQLGSLDNPA